MEPLILFVALVLLLAIPLLSMAALLYRVYPGEWARRRVRPAPARHRHAVREALRRLVPRPRWRTRSLMALVAVVAVALAGLIEAGVKTPARQALRARIAHHEQIAGIWSRWADDLPRWSGLREECREIALWHLRVAGELRGQGTSEAASGKAGADQMRKEMAILRKVSQEWGR